MNKTLENIKSGFVIWFTALFVMITWWVIYAMLNNTWTEPEEASTWSPLTAELWNDTQSNIKYLWEKVWGIESTTSTLTTNLNTLSWTVANLQSSSSNVPNVSWQVKFRNKYYKSWWDTTYTWTNAKAYCDNLWTGWRLPSSWDLRYIYDNKSSLGSLSLQTSSYYWSDELYYESGTNNGARVLDMNNGSLYGDSITYSHYVVCVHD
jgi:hypothetical protein